LNFKLSYFFPRAENPKDGSHWQLQEREREGYGEEIDAKTLEKYRTKSLFIESELLTEKGIRTIFENIADKSIYQLRSEVIRINY